MEVPPLAAHINCPARTGPLGFHILHRVQLVGHLQEQYYQVPSSAVHSGYSARASSLEFGSRGQAP